MRELLIELRLNCLYLAIHSLHSLDIRLHSQRHKWPLLSAFFSQPIATMRYLPLVHACLLTSAAQRVAAAAIPVPPETPVLPSSGTVNDDDAASNADCIPGKTCGTVNPNRPKAPFGGSLEAVPMVTTTDAQGNPITVPAVTNNPVPPGPTADKASVSVTVINGNTPVIADPISPTPPADVVGGNVDASDCDAQAISDPVPPKPPNPGVPAADQVYTTTDVRGTVFTVPAWLPKPTEDKVYTTTDVRGNVFTVPGWLPQPTDDYQADEPVPARLPTASTGVFTPGGLPLFADPIPPPHPASEVECDEEETSTDTPVVTRPPGGHGVTVSSISPVDTASAQPTTDAIDAAGNIIGTPSDDTPCVDPVPENLSTGSGVVNDPLTPHKIYGDGHIMTPIMPVDIATTTTTHPHYTEPTRVVNSEGATVQIDPRPPRPASVDTSGLDPTYVDPVPPAVPTDVPVYVDPIPPAPPNGNVPSYVDPIPPAIPTDVSSFVDPVPPTAPNSGPEPTRYPTIYGDGHQMTAPKQATDITQIDQAKRQDAPTPSTRSATTSNRRKPCGANICGGPTCASGSAAWVTVAPINCLTIPVNTAANAQAQPTEAPPRKDYFVEPTQQSAPPSPTSPLMDYAKQSKQLDDWLVALLVRLNARKSWYIHSGNEISGKWYGFENFHTAAGLARMHGCTAVFIVSKQGAYVAHIYEIPMFVREPEPGKFIPTPDELFRKGTFEALVHGQENKNGKGHNSEGFLDPIEGLVGTAEKPGPLHFTNQPKIFIVPPFENLENESGPILYPEKVAMLSNLLYEYLYPSGSEQYAQEPMTLPYKIAAVDRSEDTRNSDGKAHMEASKIVRYDRVGDKLVPVGRWRLWVNRIELATWEFSGIMEKEIGERDKGTDDLLYAGVCPVSTATTTPTALALAASSSASAGEVSPTISHPTRPN